MKVQAEKKTRKQARERTRIGQTFAVTRTKTGANHSSLEIDFIVDGFYFPSLRHVNPD